MVYLIISQVIMFLMNLAILINSKFALEYYKIFYTTIPVILYTVCTCTFYITALINSIRKSSSTRAMPLHIIIPALVMNIVYLIIEVFVDKPENPFFFYIGTTSIQFINILFVFTYQKKNIEKYMKPKEAALNNIFLYTYTLLSVGTIYACVFINIYITVILLLVTSLIMTLSLSLSKIAIDTTRKKYRRRISH